jgi:hypothetical protein
MQLNSWSASILDMLKPRVWYKLITARASMSSVFFVRLMIGAMVQNLIHCDIVWKKGHPLTQKMSMKSRMVLYLAMMGSGIRMGW